MKCPSCTDTLLVMSDRQGVEVDYCPQCRGAWLDRGELDKLIERSTAMAPTPASSAAARSPPEFADSDYEHGRGPQRYRKKSWLSTIILRSSVTGGWRATMSAWSRQAPQRRASAQGTTIRNSHTASRIRCTMPDSRVARPVP